MEWDDLKHFLAVARVGSLSEAARVLKTSPATVGRRIATLEERLATRLFDRSQAGYSLTQSGEAIRLKSEGVEEAVLSVEREAFGRDLRATGKVRVATAEDIAAFVIAPRLAEFRRSYPGIVLEIVASWDVVSLTRREADIAIRTVKPTQPDVVIQQAGVWNCAVYVSKRYAANRKLKQNMTELRDVDLISWTDGSTFRGGNWFGDHAAGAPVVFSANSRHIQYAACKAGLGAAILPCVAADHDPKLIRLLPPERVRSVGLWLVTHQDLVRTARVRCVLDFLTEILPSTKQSLPKLA